MSFSLGIVLIDVSEILLAESEVTGLGSAFLFNDSFGGMIPPLIQLYLVLKDQLK